MSKVSTRTRFDIISMVGPAFGKQFQNELGQTIIDEMKNDIAKGNSPVRGEGRFTQYKDPDKYPGDQKPKRMVNLNLTGAMLDALTFEPIEGESSILVGYLTGSAEVKGRAIRHNTGGDGVPQRKTIPWEGGDELSVRITRKLVDLYKQRLARVIKDSNT